MVGTYDGEVPSPAMMHALYVFLDKFGVGTENLPANYTMYAHRDIECTLCPGGVLRSSLMSRYPANYGTPAPQKCNIYTNQIHPE
jgi:hypothetical protein